MFRNTIPDDNGWNRIDKLGEPIVHSYKYEHFMLWHEYVKVINLLNNFWECGNMFFYYEAHRKMGGSYLMTKLSS